MNDANTTRLTDTIHIPEQPTPSSLRCRHTVDGRRCGSPAMRGERFCYHHHQTRRPVAALRQRRARQATFSVPAPESRPQIQQAIGDIMLRIANNDIDPRRAGLLLYALQLATSNLNEHQRLNARSAESRNHPAEPASSGPVQQEVRQPDTHSTEQMQTPHIPSTSPAPTKETCHPEQTQSSQSHTGTPQLPAKKKCHPERSGEAAESKDLRSTSSPAPHNSEPIHYGSGPTPDLSNPQTQRPSSTDFTPPPPVWRNLSKSIGADLLHRYFHPELYNDPGE